MVVEALSRTELDRSISSAAVQERSAAARANCSAAVVAEGGLRGCCYERLAAVSAQLVKRSGQRMTARVASATEGHQIRQGVGFEVVSEFVERYDVMHRDASRPAVLAQAAVPLLRKRSLDMPVGASVVFMPTAPGRVAISREGFPEPLGFAGRRTEVVLMVKIGRAALNVYSALVAFQSHPLFRVLPVLGLPSAIALCTAEAPCG